MSKKISFFVFSVVVVSSLFAQYLLPYEDEWKSGMYGYIDETGKIIIPAQFEFYGQDYGEPFYEGMRQAAYTPGQKQTVFFKNDGIKVTYNFEIMSDFSGGIALAVSDNKRVFVNIAGQSFPANYEHFYTDVAEHHFNEGIAFVLDENNKTIAIDTSLRKLFELPVDFSHTSHKFSSGLLAVRNARGLWGYMDITGKLVIPAKFALSERLFGDGRYNNDSGNEYTNFRGEYALLSDEDAGGNKFYVINKKGETIKEFEFSGQHNFHPYGVIIHGNYLVYEHEGIEGILKIVNLLNGKEIEAGEKQEYSVYSTPKALGENIYYNGKIISYNGEILFQIPNYKNGDSDMKLWYNKFIVIHKEGYFIIYDENGNEITPQ